MTHADENSLPDLQQGIDNTKLLLNQPLKGVVGQEEILLVRTESAVYAVGAECPHKGASMEDGLVVGHSIRCPWHHACFDMAKQGSPCAPAMDSLPCYKVVQKDGKIHVTEREDSARADHLVPERAAGAENEAGMIIVGAGASGQAAAESLRRYGYTGTIRLISAGEHLPIDRTILSKDFLSGDKSVEDIQLRDEAFYAAQDIQLLMQTSVVAINAKTSSLTLSDDVIVPYHKLLLAMGATPRSLPVEGVSATHVHTLRHLADAKRLIEALENPVEHVVVVGSGFIGLEAAAILREQDIKVRVITSENLPMQALVGKEMADYIRSKHESYGVEFVFNGKLEKIEARSVKTEQGDSYPADLVLMAVGVQPDTELVEAGDTVSVDDGIVVSEYLQSSDERIFAAGDLARWPYQGGAEEQSVRIEHWAVAQRQGQVAACNMLGVKTPFRAVPFFWSKQYDINIRYSGHAQEWDTCEIDGSVQEESFSVRYFSDTVPVAMLSVNQDMNNLKFEAELEKKIAEKAAGTPS